VIFVITKKFETMKTTGIERFIKAQDAHNSYQEALKEINDGCKWGHWIWYVFPQIKGLGYSEMSQYYGIDGRAEAEEYLGNETLNKRLHEISTALLAHKGKSAYKILGGIDAKKVRSSMTLFDAIEPNSVFAEVLDAFYDGKRCERTLEAIKE